MSQSGDSEFSDAGECPVCARRGGRQIPSHQAAARGVRYLQCLDCGLGRLSPMPVAELEDLYDEGYFVGGGERAGYPDYVADEPWHRRTAKARLNRLARFTTEQGLLIDVGTAVGFVPDEARRRGYSVAAVEISQWAADQARARGIRVEPTLQDLDDLAGTAAVVSLYQVLEHTPDPVAEVRQAFRLLRPGGVLVCETWDLDSRTARLFGAHWQQLSPPSVLWLLTAQSTRRLLEPVGFQPLSWQRSPKVVSLATVAAKPLAAGGDRTQRWAAPLAARIPVPYPLDDLVTFVAKKPA